MERERTHERPRPRADDDVSEADESEFSALEDVGSELPENLPVDDV